jgi:hypothetical protein
MLGDRVGRARIPLLKAFRSSTRDLPIGALMGEVVAPADDGVVVAAVDGRIVAASPLHEFKGADRWFTLLFPPGVDNSKVRFALVADGVATELEAVAG